MTPDALEDRIRAALARAAWDEAATETIRGYGPAILGYLTRVLHVHDDAADAFSLFSEQLWRGLPRFRGAVPVRVWAYHVAWSAAMKVLSDGYRRRRERFRTSMASRVAAEVLTRAPAAAEQRASGVERLRQALQPDERSLLVLRLDQRLAWKEIAEVMSEDGRPVGEVALRKRFERIKEKLAREARSAGLLE